MMKKTQSKYSEDWLPIKSISNGMINLDNVWMVTGKFVILLIGYIFINLLNLNIFILDYQTQNNIIMNLRNFYSTIDYEFWLVVADRPVDIKMYLSQLQLDFDNAGNQAIRKLIGEDIEKAEMFSSNQYNVVDTEYYLLFRDKDLEKINKHIQQLITGLASTGLISSKTSDEDLKFLLQNFLNGGVKNEFGTVVTNE